MPHIESERRLVPVSKTQNTSVSLQNTLDPKKKYTRGGIIVRAYDVHMKRVRYGVFAFLKIILLRTNNKEMCIIGVRAVQLGHRVM